MWPGMKILRAAASLPITALLLACASPVAPVPASLPGFGKSLASELDLQGAGTLDSVHADEAGKLWVMGAGTKKRPLASDLNLAGFALTAAARGLGDDGRALRWEWLATLSRDAQAGLSVLSIHDTDGGLAHEEVLLEDCSRLAWRDGDAPELLVGCQDRVWRYRPGPASEAVVTAAQFARSGSAFGPLSFGDAPPRVRAALQLAGGVCRGEPCSTWGIQLDERDFTLLPQFQNGALSRLTVFGPRRPRAAWRTKVKDDWKALVSAVARETAAADTPYPSATALTAVPETEGVFFAETHRPQRDGAKATIGLFRNETGNARGFGAIAVITPPSAPAPVPAAAAD
jgi:hypothetical protein